MATLKVPSSVPSPLEDADRLRKAFVGWGTDEKTIVSILGHRTASQRMEIRRVYKELFGEELFTSLDKEISGDFERIVLLWTFHPAERDAFLANEAARKWNPSNRVLIEVACARSSGQLFAARQAYHARYKRSLEEDVAAHTTGDFRKLLVPLVSAFRYEGEEVNKTLAKSEAKILHEKISDKGYNDEELIRIITTRSKAQLLATFNHYNDQFGHPINKDLKSDPKDEYLAALRATIRCFTCPAKYFEKVVRFAINKLGTDEYALTRVITTRAEVDLQEIKDVYQQRNSVAMDHAVSGETSGDYKSMLLALLGHEEA
ncbi:uncharacterized protein A4U43_C03F2150 [Asparagus officinalis]|uniref:Annexin n=1 Tax=Asparagus officinalis TaxID=4686 RepID=A0A5P1F6Q2_ASPOF|nr:annexin D7-like [Asparagus officinalis]ONK74038.1 uncharacterized protein A4U43_C03F2150 [Asparagus officinalis]